MPFKKEQHVVVKGAYYGGADGDGLILKKGAPSDKPNHGKWLVDLGFTTMWVEEDRLEPYPERKKE